TRVSRKSLGHHLVRFTGITRRALAAGVSCTRGSALDPSRCLVVVGIDRSWYRARIGGHEQLRLQSIWHDIRFAFRTLRRNPGFAATAVLILGLGVGASTAIFAVFNAVLLKPLPYTEPSRLVA